MRVLNVRLSDPGANWLAEVGRLGSTKVSSVKTATTGVARLLAALFASAVSSLPLQPTAASARRQPAASPAILRPFMLVEPTWDIFRRRDDARPRDEIERVVSALGAFLSQFRLGCFGGRRNAWLAKRLLTSRLRRTATRGWLYGHA